MKMKRLLGALIIALVLTFSLGAGAQAAPDKLENIKALKGMIT
jgi:hypothetical protein